MIARIGVEAAVRILIGIRATYVLGNDYRSDHIANVVDINRQVGRYSDGIVPVDLWDTVYDTRPDIVDRSLFTVYEVKSSKGFTQGIAQVKGYVAALNQYHGTTTYHAGNWQPTGSFTLTSLPGIVGLPAITLTAWNAGHGVIVYEDIPIGMIAGVLTIVDVALDGVKLVSTSRFARLEGEVSFRGLIATVLGTPL